MWVILPGGMQCVLAQSWAAAAVPGEDWHPGQQDQPRFPGHPPPQSTQRGQGELLVTGPARNTADNPQTSTGPAQTWL